jgi:hypothetical protein
MNLLVGYRPTEDASRTFAEGLLAFRADIRGVYFAWPAERSGRPPLPREVTDRMVADLRQCREAGLELHLLLNAACDGGTAASLELRESVLTTMRRCTDSLGAPDGVTTASPSAAYVLRYDWPALPVQASVNMRLGTVAAMAQVVDLFDGYCVQRDVQRDVACLRRLRDWADRHGKRLSLLANSGCLRHCATQTWHDNLVAHFPEAAERTPLPGFVPLTCRRFLADPAHHQALLQATWIRPEDLHHYDDIVDSVKLATRSHPRPFQVVRAYAERRHRGNLLDLLEPGLGRVLGNAVLDNTRFPPDWFAHTQECPADGQCPRCASILESVRVAVGADMPAPGTSSRRGRRKEAR